MDGRISVDKLNRYKRLDIEQSAGDIQEKAGVDRLYRDEDHVTRVVVVDDHPRVREGLRNILEFAEDIEVIGEAGNGIQALNLVEELGPDVLILDIEMPRLNGNEVAERLQQRRSPVQVLAVSAHDDQQYIINTLESGASGYLIKEEVPEILVRAVRGVARGETMWVSKKVAKKLSVVD